MARSLHRFAAVAVATTVAVLLASCGGADGGGGADDGGGGNSGADGPAGVLNIGQFSLGTEDWTPWYTQREEKVVLDLVNESLIYANPDDRSLEPGLATSWSLSDDGKTWTFELQEGVPFHGDWGEMTAEDVKYTWEQYIREDATTPGAAGLRAAVGGDMDNFKIIDDYTFSVTADEPVPDLAYNLSHASSWSLLVQSKKYWEEVGEEEAARKPIGTGPFEFVEHKRGQGVTVKAVRDHWRKTPAFETVNIKIIPDPTAMLAQVRSGNVDLAELSSSLKPEAEAAGIKTYSTPSVANASMVFGGMYAGTDAADPDAPWIQASSPERGRAIREAMSLAIDRQAIVDNVLNGEGAPAQSLFSFTPGDFEFIDPSWTVPEYNPELAKEKLAEGGYPDGFAVDMPIYELAGRPDMVVMANAVADMYEAIGIKVKRVPIDWSPTFRTKLGERDTKGQVWLNAGSFYDEPILWFRGAASEAAPIAFLSDPIIEDAMESLSGESDPEARADLHRQFGSALLEKQLGAPVVMLNLLWIANDKVADVRFVSGQAALNSVEYIEAAD